MAHQSTKDKILYLLPLQLFADVQLNSNTCKEIKSLQYKPEKWYCKAEHIETKMRGGEIKYLTHKIFLKLKQRMEIYTPIKYMPSNS